MRFTAEKVEKPAPTNGIGPEGAPPGKLLYRGRPLYGGGLGLRRTARAGVIQDAADFGFVEGLGEQVVSAQFEGFGPETGIRLRIGDDHFGFPRAFADEVQDIEPLAIGQVGFGKNDVVIRLVEPRTRMAAMARAPTSREAYAAFGRGGERLPGARR